MLKIPILTYHDILAPDSVEEIKSPLLKPYTLPAEIFERHLTLVRSEDYTVISIEDLLVKHLKKEGSSAKLAVITFDDGLLGNYLVAYPLLKKAGCTATFFVIAGKIGEDNMMSWGHLQELVRNGMTVGSHTLTHRYPSELNEEEIRYELIESKKLLEDRLRIGIDFLSVPTGFHNKKMLEIAEEAGYKAVCSGIEGAVRPDSDLYSLPSFCIRNGIKEEEFIKILHCDNSMISKRRLRQATYKAAKKVLGVKGYEMLKLALQAGR